MMRTATTRRRSGSRRPRPSRFPVPGYPRGTSVPGRGAVSRFFSAQSTRQMRSASLTADLGAAVAMVAGVFFWGGLLVLLVA